MKQIYFLILFLSFSFFSYSQTLLAIQDFESTPAAPAWSFSGIPVYNSGTSDPSAAPGDSPIGINNSRAWETTSIPSGLTLEFDNVIIPSGYNEILFEFKLAAMSLISSFGGPDNLDYVLVQYSTDNGNTYYPRLRIRGAVNDNSFWAYDASGVAIVDYQPTTETVFQPTNPDLATTEGYSTVGIKFPGTTTQVKIKITARSSSSSDTWLIDNVKLSGINALGNDKFTLEQNKIKLFPNPTQDFIQISELNKTEDYKIYNSYGIEVKNGIISNDKKINIQNLSSGVYFLQLKNGNTLKFIKE